MHDHSTLDYAYSIDAYDTVVSVCPNWLKFARENEAYDLTEESVLGRSLFDFMSGEETKRLYRLVFGQVRDNRQSVRLPFRCDGPTVRRYMELLMSPNGLGGIDFTGRVLREEARKEVRLFAPSVDRTRESIAVCAWCKQVLVESGEWVEAEAAISQLGLFESLQLPGIVQSVCESCEKKLKHT